MEKEFLLFIHIPKTAGTTLRSIIDAQYGAKNVLTFHNQPNSSLIDNLGALLQLKPNYKALIGHFKYGAHRNINRKFSYITFVRNPINRCISEYNERTRRAPDTYKNKDGSLISIAQMIDIHTHDFSNLQTKYLCGVPLETQITPAHVHQALSNITNNFSHVGIVENFDDSINLISNKLCWGKPKYKILNQKPHNISLDEEVIKRLRNANQFDIELYQKILSTTPETGRPN